MKQKHQRRVVKIQEGEAMGLKKSPPQKYQPWGLLLMNYKDSGEVN